MAIKTAATDRRGRATLIEWQPLQSGDTGEWVPFWEFLDRTVQVTGVFAGANIAFQGSLDTDEGTRIAFPLHDSALGTLAYTAAAMGVVLENALYIRPVCTGGNVTTAIVPKLLGLQ